MAASHILIAHQDAQRATVDRTLDQARTLAAKVRAELQGGADFAKLAAQYSDDPGSKMRGGALGKFSRQRMVKPFADAAFALQPGQVSGIVESPFGLHIIKRTE